MAYNAIPYLGNPTVNYSHYRTKFFPSDSLHRESGYSKLTLQRLRSSSRHQGSLKSKLLSQLGHFDEDLRSIEERNIEDDSYRG